MSIPPPPPTVTKFPLHFGSDEDFAHLRQFFAAAEYDDATLCRRLRIERMSRMGTVPWPTFSWEGISTRLRWLIQVMLRGEIASVEESLAACGPETFALLTACRLLVPLKDQPNQVVCPVWLYPVDGFVVASDRREDNAGIGPGQAEDIVFPAIYAGTERFLELLPEVGGGDALDLCGGSGIGALHLARNARSAETADLTERSATFAEFNARLNGVAIRSLCGDLYAPAAGRQFDVITAHPPFVPSTNKNMIYRDGGDTGEDITRRVIEGLPAHLRPGGVGFILCFACDTQEKRFEQRAADWLGAHAAEFEIVFGLERVMSVEELVESIRKRGQAITVDEARGVLQRIKSLGTRQFVYGALQLRRLRGERGAAPARLELTLAGRAADFARFWRWRQVRRQADFASWLAAARPRLSPGLELTVRHVMRDGELVPVEFVFRVLGGFEAALRLDGWVVPLVARLDGTRAVGEVLNAAAAADELPAGFSLPAFAGLVAQLIEQEFMVVELPAASGAAQ